MQKLLFGLTLIAATSSFAQDINFPAQERWLAQHAGFVCGEDRVPTQAPTDFKTRAVLFSYMTTDYSLDNGKFVASYHSKGTECRYNLIGLADNVNWTFTKTDTAAYPVNGGSSENCIEGKEYLDSLFAQPVKYIYHHGAMSLLAPVSDAATLCGDDATTVGIYFKKSVRTKID
ncbi:hypothetical protein [Bacteriovorax sp. Seq25_V]|uniref:hypothetical protein n=1 Tax=Bacteriovorax sp. Seq25_V TaxID=1201288 RepID=UPI00038A5105|nr:hypothetical protein [Bacteriovorax sp. Seq25_V]EQC47133.1 hypothetical protein M900_0609 [Bacteriovorax sp. Seq25_V]